LDGKHAIHSTPSVFKICATTCCVFIHFPPQRGYVSTNNEPAWLATIFLS
jgi:hypothetical protein